MTFTNRANYGQPHSQWGRLRLVVSGRGVLQLVPVLRELDICRPKHVVIETESFVHTRSCSFLALLDLIDHPLTMNRSVII